MKDNTNYFYGMQEGIVPISERIYQPVDISSLVQKESFDGEVVNPTFKVVRKVGLFTLFGFLVGGVLGELYLYGSVSSSELDFLLFTAPFFQAISLNLFLSTIFSAGVFGTLLGLIVGLLALIEVPD